MIMRDIPLPIPFSVISSPNHMTNIVPAVSVTMVENLKKNPGVATTGVPLAFKLSRNMDIPVD